MPAHQYIDLFNIVISRQKLLVHVVLIYRSGALNSVENVDVTVQYASNGNKH